MTKSTLSEWKSITTNALQKGSPDNYSKVAEKNVKQKLQIDPSSSPAVILSKNFSVSLAKSQLKSAKIH